MPGSAMGSAAERAPLLSWYQRTERKKPNVAVMSAAERNGFEVSMLITEYAVGEPSWRSRAARYAGSIAAESAAGTSSTKRTSPCGMTTFQVNEEMPLAAPPSSMDRTCTVCEPPTYPPAPSENASGGRVK